MSFQAYVDYRNEADDERQARAFKQAGDDYTLAAYTALSKSGLQGTADIARGLSSLMSAAICYRLDGNRERARNRCRQGILIAEDLREYQFETALSQGAMWEHIGDFRTIGDLAEAQDAYEMARDRYSEAGNPMEYACTEEFDATINIFRRVVEAIDYDTAWEAYQSTQLERIDAKRAEFAEALEAVLEEGLWEYESE